MNTAVLTPLFDRFRRTEQNRWGTGLSVGVAALIVGVVASGTLLAINLVKRNAARNQHKHVEKARDKTLKDSFPASDPPASQYFDIPVNRR